MVFTEHIEANSEVAPAGTFLRASPTLAAAVLSSSSALSANACTADLKRSTAFVIKTLTAAVIGPGNKRVVVDKT